MHNGGGYANVDVTELRNKIVELENEKTKAEAEVVGWKKRFEGLEARISQLENDADLLMGMESSISNKVEGIANVSDKDTCEVESPTRDSPRAESDNSRAGSREHASTVVEISDSDDDCNVLPQNQMTPQNSPEVSHLNRMDMNNGSFALNRKQDDQDPKIENSFTDNNTQSSKHTSSRAGI